MREKKTALLFAGQGAQVVGMGADFYSDFDSARRLFNEANHHLGIDLTTLCFQGPGAELTRTENAQPAIFLVSWTAFILLREHFSELEFHAAAGLSLGEFTALTAAGVFSFEDGLKLVRQRGQFMQEACETTQGSMAALIGLEEAKAREVCVESGVELANLNCPGQLVISGPAENISRACHVASQKGAKRALPLAVAGAYHSRLMESARPKLQRAIASIPLNIPAIPVISNVTATPHEAPPDIHQRLVEQVVSPVLWEKSIRYLIAQGFTRFIELGPGTTLNGFLKRIDKSVEGLNVSDSASLEITLKQMSS